MDYDLLLHNGNFVRFDGDKNYHWLLVNNGVIVDAGYETQYLKYKNKFRKSFDLLGKTVVPGFYDCHVHYVQTVQKSISLDLNGVKSFLEIQERIEDWVDHHPDCKVVRAYGLEMSDLEEKQLPTRRVLDRYAKDYSVWINSRDFHQSVMNSKAIHSISFPLTLEGVEWDEDGQPTGIFSEQANAVLRKIMAKSYKEEEKFQAIFQLAREALKKGVTSIHAMEGGYEFNEEDMLFLRNIRDSLPIDIRIFFGITDVSRVVGMGLRQIGGDIYVDGSFSSYTASLFEPYEATENYGRIYYSQDELDELVLEAYQSDVNISLHAVGDKGLEQVLLAHENARSVYPEKTNMRNRVEHAELSSPEQLERAKKVNLIFSMQPAFEYFYGGPDSMYEDRLGDRYLRTNAYRQILDGGVVICGGSDSDLTPINPLLGIHAAVNHSVKENRISVEEALKFFTYNAAYSVGEEEFKGSIEIGKAADLAVLSDDIYHINKKGIVTVSVLATIKGGDMVYNNY